MKFFYGKWDSWGLEVSWCHSDKTFVIGLVRWYLAICFWKFWSFDYVAGQFEDEEMLDKEAYTDKMDS